MTEEERELEEKIKQYKYELEENEKKMETLYNDTHKTKKRKTLIMKANKTLGVLGMVWIIIVTLFLVFLVWLALSNYIGALKQFDPVKTIEDRYDINLKQISRESEKKLIIYKVKPSSWKYRKIEFSIVMEGTTTLKTDIDDQFLKYIIENIKNKEILQGFEILEDYQEYNLLEYSIVYKGDSKESEKKISDLKRYILEYDKEINRIINLNYKISM